MKYTNDTKNLIFYKCIELFSEYSFELVSISDIAKAIGKTKSSIYNHFSSKQEILDEIYDFFCEHFTDNRNTIEEIEPIIQNGSIMDIIHSVFFSFGDLESVLLPILRIVHQRKYHDETARLIVQNILLADGVKYAEDVFNRAVETGRLAPFDTHCLAVLCNNSRHYIYEKWILNPTNEYYMTLSEEEDLMFSYVNRLITDLNPPESGAAS